MKHLKDAEQLVYRMFCLFVATGTLSAIALIVLVATGCQSSQPKGITGPYSDMAHVAAQAAYNELRSYGAPVQPYSGWSVRLVQRPAGYQWPGHGPSIDAVTFGTNRIEFRQMSGSLMQHEWKHILLNRAGMIAESNSHDRRYFPEGNKVRMR